MAPDIEDEDEAFVESDALEKDDKLVLVEDEDIETSLKKLSRFKNYCKIEINTIHSLALSGDEGDSYWSAITMFQAGRENILYIYNL